MTERLNTLLTMIQGAPDDSFIRYALAKEYEYADDTENALKQYLILREIDPKYVGFYYHLAKLYELIDQPEMALSTYEEGIHVAKGLSDFHALSELNSAKMNLEIEM
ncbi:MAG: tetratricopeptide repeat protein [Saprospiraceae bacterium]